MAEFVVPRLGVTVTEVEIVAWLVPDGAVVQAGDGVVTVVTDKVEVDIEATTSGTLRHGANVGETHPVAAVIGWID